MLVRETAVRTIALAESSEVPLQQLDPPRRTVVVMAIVGLVLLGVVLIMAVMIGARWTRRLARERLPEAELTSTPRPSPTQAEKRPSIESDRPSSETLYDPPQDDTVAE